MLIVPTWNMIFRKELFMASRDRVKRWRRNKGIAKIFGRKTRRTRWTFVGNPKTTKGFNLAVESEDAKGVTKILRTGISHAMKSC